MGLLHKLFHKLKIGFERLFENPVPFVDESKRYGEYGEDWFVSMLLYRLPCCKIKRNVIIATADGNAELDCLVLYRDKLFAVEVKRWKGRFTENGNIFVKAKDDRWTGETHIRCLKSPFQQLGRAVYLLKKQIPSKVWINTVVYFECEEPGAVTVYSDNIWFDKPDDLINYFENEGRASPCAVLFFEKCVSAGCLYSFSQGRRLRCIIDRESLAAQLGLSRDDIVSIEINHHWAYDDMTVTFLDGSKQIIMSENDKVIVSNNGKKQSFALCKIDCIEVGTELKRR